MFLDPVSWVPILGWGKKAKQMQKGVDYGMSLGQSVRRGALSGAGVGLVGYYGEDDMTRGEGVLAGTAFGGTLAYGASKFANKMRKASGKKPLIPSSEQRQQMAGEDLVQQAKEGKLLSPDEMKAAQQQAIDSLMEENPSYLSKSISGLNIRKNYEDIVGTKVWDMMVQNWGAGLAGMAAASGGYSALDDPEASELQKFGAAIAFGLASAGGVKGLKRIPVKEGTLGELISKGFVDNYGLGDDYVKLKKGTLAEVNTIRSQFLDIVKATDAGLTEDEQKVFYAMLHGIMDDVPELKGLKESTRKIIFETGQELVDVGLLDAKIFRKNAETYLHRSYDSKMLADATNPQAIRAARDFKIIGDELKPRGKVEKTTLNAFNNPDSKWQKEGWEIINDSDPKKISVRRDYTKSERELMGEIENASFAIAETGRLMTNDLAAYKLFSNIADSDFAVDSVSFGRKVADGEIVEDAWIKVPNTTKYKGKAHTVYEYGKLADQYVPKEVYNDLSKLIPSTKDDFSKLLGQKYLGLMRLWKKSKTAWNPTVHVNNTMSNVMMFDNANGQYRFINRGMKELKDGLDGRTNATLYRMAREDGIFDVDILTRELNSETSTALEKALNEFKQEGRNELHNSINYSKKLITGSKQLYNKTFGKMEEWYQAEDQVFRMALYMDRLNKGMSRADAAADAKKWFIDYDINAPAVNFLKNSATPFISYTYRVVPLLAETAAKRPWKFAKWASFGYTLNEFGKAYGVGDEEAERALMPERFKEPMFGVPGFPATTIKTPFQAGRSEAGKEVPLYIDTTRFIPGGDIFQMGEKGIPLPIPVPFSESITGKTKFLRAPAAIQPNFGIAGEILAPMMFGVDPFTQEKIKGLGLGNDEVVKMQHVLSRLNPNIPAPYILPEKYESFSSKKIREAFEAQSVEGRKKYGTDFTPFEAIMSSFGFKLQPIQVSKLLQIEDAKFRSQYSEARSQYFKLMQKYKESPTPENKEKTQEQIDILYKDMENLARIYKAKRAQTKSRDGKKLGGVAIDKNKPVTDVTEFPSERINPYTNEPYLEREQFALGGDVDEFVPLSSQVEELASMESSEQGAILSAGVMPMETLERKEKSRVPFNKGSQELIHPQNKEYFKNFHNQVLNDGNELVVNGKTVTMNIIGVQHKGKEYLIPSYDPTNKKILNAEDAKKEYLKDIESGKLKGYNSIKSAENDREIFYKPIVEK